MNVLITASTTNAVDAALAVSGVTWLADLGEVDGGQQARPQALLHQVERRKQREQTADQRERHDQEREPDHRAGRQRDHHAKRHEKQRDEKIAQRGHLGGDVERVREG